MPSAYLLVHGVVPTGERQILLTDKNIIGSRLHGNAHAQLVWNSGGQRVIPGGAPGANEGWEDAAKREFFEETGVDFRDPAVRQQYGYIGEHLWVGPKQQYAVSYLEIRGAMLVPLCTQINQNVNGAVPPDDEVHAAVVVPRLNAGTQFAVCPNPPQPGTWQLPQYNSVNPPLVPRRNQQMAAPFDWFVAGMTHCPQ